MAMKWNATLVACGDSFRIEAELGEGAITIKPIGLINEDVNFGAVLEFIQTLSGKPNLVKFDLSAVSRINSCGIREWLLFMQRIQSRFPCAFTKANENFIEVAASAPTVFGKQGTPLDEIEAPYFCAACSRRFMIYVKASSCYKDGAAVVPKLDCPQCKAALEFDGLEDEYFEFLKHVFG